MEVGKRKMTSPQSPPKEGEGIKRRFGMEHFVPADKKSW